MDEGYAFLIRYVLFVLAAVIAWFDRHIVDGAVNVVAWVTQGSGHALRLAQTGRVQSYAIYVFIGMVFLMGMLTLLQPDWSLLGGAR